MGSGYGRREGMRAKEPAAMASLSPSPTSIYDLPEFCMSYVLSRTTPRDLCRMASVSSTFRSASDSDYVWERMLPPDWKEIVSRAVSPVRFSSKKELFFLLSSYPLIIDDGKRSFSIDRSTGKKIFMLSARELFIVWGEDPRYWRWTTNLYESRFPEVAELLSVCWLEIRGSIEVSVLSPHTHYSAYCILKHIDRSFGFDSHPAELSLRLTSDSEVSNRLAYIHQVKPPANEAATALLPVHNSGGHGLGRFVGFRPRGHLMSIRSVPPRSGLEQRRAVATGGEWMEINLGDFYTSNTAEDGGRVEFSLMEVTGGHWKSGLVLEGIEIRPRAHAKPCA